MSGDTKVGGSSRRQFLQAALAASLVGVGTKSPMRVPAARIRYKRRTLGGISPDAALEELLAGNRRFASGQLTSPDRDLKFLRAHTVDKQEPFAAVLACADSRVPVELVFDQSIGQLFVARLAGNVVTPEIIASLEYGVAVLGVGAILVLGHSHCGAVKAAMKAESVPGQISVLYTHLRPAVEQSAGDVEKAVVTNATIQAELLRTSSTVVGQAIAARTVKVAAGVYDLGTGRVTLS